MTTWSKMLLGHDTLIRS